MTERVSQYSYNGIGLTDKVIIVTGGPTGIGRGITLALAHEGGIPVPTNPYRDDVEDVLRVLGEKGVTGVPEVTVDVTSSESIEKLRDAVMDEYGRIDGLVNCAGVHLKKPTVDTTTDEFNRVLDVHLGGTFRTCKVVGEAMIEQGSGSIVNIGSITSFMGMYQVSAYGAAKGGVVTMTKSLAGEWAEYGINVNAIAPGFILTDMNRTLLDENEDRLNMILNNTPMGTLGNPDDVAGAAVFLLSDASNFITGTSILVDGGFLNCSSR